MAILWIFYLHNGINGSLLPLITTFTAINENPQIPFSKDFCHTIYIYAATHGIMQWGKRFMFHFYNSYVVIARVWSAHKMCVYSKNSGWRNKCFWSLFKAIVICEINCLFPLTKMCPAVLITRNSFSTLLLKFLSLMKKWCLMNEGNKFFLYWFKAVTQQNHNIIMYTLKPFEVIFLKLFFC